MTAPELTVWDDAIRQHDRRVYLSVLALGLPPDRAREVTQQTWTRLMEQHAQGKLGQLELPGLAILEDAPLRDALKMLIMGSGSTYNLVIPDDIEGKVTIRFSKVPWNHAFEAVLASQGLWYRYGDNGKLIRVAPRHQIEDEDARGR
jgi:hypothetical protein